MTVRCPRKLVRNVVILISTILLITVQVTVYLRFSSKAKSNPPRHDDEFLIPQRIIHLDFKGGPPKLSFYRKLFPILSSAGATGLLVEYEDYFPYDGALRNLSSRTAWSPAEVAQFLRIAHAAGLQVIPLVQTLGHLEFALKLTENVHLRENPSLPDTACPSEPATRHLISEMIRQVLSRHPQSKAIHLGMDEARLSKHCPRCLSQQGVDILVEHIQWASRKAVQIRPEMRLLIWDDMFRHWPLKRLIGLAEVWRMVQPVVWAYSRDVIIEIPARTWVGYQRAIPNLWIASAFMGADGQTVLTPNVSERLHNHIVWLQRSSSTLISSTQSKSIRALISSTSSLSQVSSIVLTGWTRYDHFGALCENLPLGVHSLVLMLTLVSAATPSDPVPIKVAAARWKDLLNCPQQVLLPTQENLRRDPFLWSAALCSYPGSDLLRAVERPVPAGLQKSPKSDQNCSSDSKYMSFEEYQGTVEDRSRRLRETGHLPEEGQNNGDGPPGTGGGRWPSTTISADSNQNQPREAKVNAQHLAELQEKHPYLFNVLKTCPPEDLVNRVFNERYRTQYMIDYGRDTEYPNLDYDKLVAISGQAGNPGLAFCPRQEVGKSKYANGDNELVSVTKRGQSDECDALTIQKAQGRGNRGGEGGGGGQNDCLCGHIMDTPRYGRVATITKEGGGGGGGGGGGSGAAAEEKPASGSDKGGWLGCGASGGSGSHGGGGAGGGGGKPYKLSYSTEYKDAYGKLGELIISSRLHSPRD